jgi:hypothetical protein
MSAQNYGSGGLHMIGTILKNLESIQEQDMVVWLPPLTKLEEGWDSSILFDWNTDTVLSYPMQQVPSLEQNIEGYLLRREIKSSPCYYFIDTSFQLGCRPQAKPERMVTQYISSFFPLVFTKAILMRVTENAHLENIYDDLELSYKLFTRDQKLAVASKALGSTYRKGNSNPSKKLWTMWHTDQSFQSWSSEIGLEFCKDNEIKILLHGTMGTSKMPLLSDKIIRWGTEVKYESFREEVLFEDAEEK